MNERKIKLNKNDERIVESLLKIYCIHLIVRLKQGDSIEIEEIPRTFGTLTNPTRRNLCLLHFERKFDLVQFNSFLFFVVKMPSAPLH